MKTQPYTISFALALFVQIFMESVRAYSEPINEGSSPFFRSDSVVIRSSEMGTDNHTFNVTFSPSFSQAPRVVFAIK